MAAQLFYAYSKTFMGVCDIYFVVRVTMTIKAYVSIYLFQALKHVFNGYCSA